MTAITIESLEAKQTELAALIEKFKAQRPITRINHPAIEIDLHPGERVAGHLLDANGHIKQTVIVLPHRLDEKLNWADVQVWAKEHDIDVASPEEYALIKANCPDLLTESWYWTNKPYAENDNYAWAFFSYGGCGNVRTSRGGSALFVRRL